MNDWGARLAELAGHLASYRPGDFLMFAPRTYWRLFELHNAAWWPLPVLAPPLGVALTAWVARGGALAARAAGVLLAAACTFVAIAFVRERYLPINWAAEGVMWLLLALAALLLVLAVVMPMPPASAKPAPLPGAAGVRGGRGERGAAAVLAAWALVGQPLVAPWAGRPLVQAEVFGLAPDPTLFTVLAWLLWAAPPAKAPALVRWTWHITCALALLGCLAAAATLATMEQPAAAAPLAVALVALGALWAGRRRRHWRWRWR